MSSQYGFESPEQKQRRLEQEAIERERRERERTDQYIANTRPTVTKVVDVLADYANVNGLESSGLHVRSGLSGFLKATVETSKVRLAYRYINEEDVRQVAKVIQDQTGKPVYIEESPERLGRES